MYIRGEGSGGSRGGSGGSNEPPLDPKLFHFHGEFQEKLVRLHKSNPPSATLNPRSKNPGSDPGRSQEEVGLGMSDFRVLTANNAG